MLPGAEGAARRDDERESVAPGRRRTTGRPGRVDAKATAHVERCEAFLVGLDPALVLDRLEP